MVTSASFKSAALRALPHFAFMLCIATLAGCATQPGSAPQVSASVNPVSAASESAQQKALRTMVAQQGRLYRAAAPLLVNNPTLCNRHARNLLGFIAKNKYSYSAEFADAAQSALGLDERLRIMGVLAGSGAAHAGVQQGDILTTIEGTPVPQGENAELQTGTMLIPLVSNRSSIKLGVQRDGAALVLNVPLTAACTFEIVLGNTDNVIAYDDGYRVMISRGMLEAVHSDEELAYVLAKEMAHDALAHADKQHMSATVGAIIDNLIHVHPDLSGMTGTAGVKPMPQELDAAADSLALYMLVRAGYNIDQTIPFWQRLAGQYPATVLNGYTAIHPATAYRLAAMGKTIAAIKAKQAGKKPLVP